MGSRRPLCRRYPIHNCKCQTNVRENFVCQAQGSGSSRAREFHPHPLTEPCVKVSPHTVLHTQLFVHRHNLPQMVLLLSSYPPLCLRVVYLPCSSLSAFPLAFRLLLPTFRQRARITVLPPLCRMPQCHRQVIALLVARTVRH